MVHKVAAGQKLVIKDKTDSGRCEIVLRFPLRVMRTTLIYIFYHLLCLYYIKKYPKPLY